MSCCECSVASPRYSFTCPECANQSGVQSRFGACNRECQKKFWKVHKKTHTAKAGTNIKEETNTKTASSTGDLGGFANMHVSSSQDLLNAIQDKLSWFKQLQPSGRAEEWLVDCYRMRVDDDYFWGGGNLHGLYDQDYNDAPGEKEFKIVVDFLVFMKLAVANQVVPKQFNFKKCLQKAAQLLNYAFEKSDAREKWGGENVFSVRPSLRRTGEMVYGNGCVEISKMEDLQATIETAASQFIVDKTVCKDVGGQAIWMNLLRKL